MGKVRTKVGHSLVMINNGRFLVGIATIGTQFAVILKLYNLPNWWNILILPVSIIVMLFLGLIYEKSGLRKSYEEESAKYFVTKFKEK